MASWKEIVRWTIVPFNILMLIGSLALIGVGFWMRYDDSFDRDLKSVIYKYDDPKTLSDEKFDVRVWLIVVFWSIIGLSLGAVVVSVFGVLGAILNRKGLMIAYLILFIILLVLEVGSGVALLCNRPSLRDTIYKLVNAEYTSNATGDLKIIQDTYSCCGTQNGVGVFNDFYCRNAIGSQLSFCDVAMFNSIDNTMMITGIVFLVVLILQLIATVLPVPLLIKRRSYKPTVIEVNRF